MVAEIECWGLAGIPFSSRSLRDSPGGLSRGTSLGFPRWQDGLHGSTGL